MKRTSRRAAKKRRLTIISLLVAVFVFASCITVGYAYFSDDLTAQMTFKTVGSPMKITAVEKYGVSAAPTTLDSEACINFVSSQKNWAVSAMNQVDVSSNWVLGGDNSYLYTFVAYDIGLNVDESGYNTRSCSASVASTALTNPSATGNGYSRVVGAYGYEWFLFWGEYYDRELPAGATAPALDISSYSALSFPNSAADNYPKYTSAAALPIAVTISNPNETEIDLIGYSCELDGVATNLLTMDAISQESPVTVAAGGTVQIIATITPKTDGTFEAGSYVVTLSDELGYDYTVTVTVG